MEKKSFTYSSLELCIIGAGAAHLPLISSLRMKPINGLNITVINSTPTSIYSGGIGYVLRNEVNIDDISIDLYKLCSFPGCTFISSTVLQVKRNDRLIFIDGHEQPIHYDLLSVAIGIGSPILDNINNYNIRFTDNINLNHMYDEYDLFTFLNTNDWTKKLDYNIAFSVKNTLKPDTRSLILNEELKQPLSIKTNESAINNKTKDLKNSYGLVENIFPILEPDFMDNLEKMDSNLILCIQGSGPASVELACAICFSSKHSIVLIDSNNTILGYKITSKEGLYLKSLLESRRIYFLQGKIVKKTIENNKTNNNAIFIHHFKQVYPIFGSSTNFITDCRHRYGPREFVLGDCCEYQDILYTKGGVNSVFSGKHHATNIRRLLLHLISLPKNKKQSQINQAVIYFTNHCFFDTFAIYGLISVLVMLLYIIKFQVIIVYTKKWLSQFFSPGCCKGTNEDFSIYDPVIETILQPYLPKTNPLALIPLDNDLAISIFKGKLYKGSTWALKLKKILDYKWVYNFSDKISLGSEIIDSMDKNRQALLWRSGLHCRGCGGKVNQESLSKGLISCNISFKPEDCSISYLENYTILNTIDTVTAFTNDAEIFAKIATAHALNDIAAMGIYTAMPRSSIMISLTIPLLATSKQKSEWIRRAISGARTSAEKYSIDISAGHTLESEIPSVTICATVYTSRPLWRLTIPSGSWSLCITGPIGIGILLSNSMTGARYGKGFDEWIKQDSDSSRKIAELLSEDSSRIVACTDITGFGLLGHLSHMIMDKVQIEIDCNKVPIFKESITLQEKGYSFGSLQQENKKRFLGCKIPKIADFFFDPVTCGPLLLAVDDTLALSQPSLIKIGNITSNTHEHKFRFI